MVAAAWGVAFLVLWLIWHANNLDEFTKATMSLILGRVLGWIDQAFQFDFGSTRSSKAKDVAIEQLSRRGRDQ
jgi:xanthine/uracil permease